MDPSDQPPDREVLVGGPARASLLDSVPPAWRRRGALVVAAALGVVVGVGTTLSWQDPPSEEPLERTPTIVADHDVRLVLVRVVAPPRPPQATRTSDEAPLRLDGVLLHGRGPGSATVARIHRPGTSLAIRVPALPVGLSVDQSAERVLLELTPRDCGLATEWTPSARPFTITWQDELGDVRTDLGGEHEASLELAMIRYLDAVCGNEGAGL